MTPATQRFTAINEKIAGPLVPVLAAFDDEDSLDIDSTCRWVQSLIERGMRMFWTTHGTSHYMCLDDREIESLNREIAAVTRGKAIFIASSAYHWSTRRCIEFVERAAEWGVDVVKLQVDWRTWAPTDDLLIEHYSAIAKATPLPLMAYTWGQPALKPPLLARILEIPEFIGLKNDTGDYAEHQAYLRVVRDAGATDRFFPMTGGTMSSFFYGYQFGAKAFATGTAIYAPEIAIGFFDHVRAGLAADAISDIEKYEEPVSAKFAPLGHWACFHAVLQAQGLFRSKKMRFPIKTLNEEQHRQVLEFMTDLRLLRR